MSVSEKDKSYLRDPKGVKGGKMERLDLTKKEDVEKLQKRIRASYQKLAKGIGNVDECSQDILLGMLEGKHQHQTIDQAVIDYLRTISGRKGMGGYTQRQNLNYADSLGPGDAERLLPVDPGRDLADGVDFERMLRTHTQLDQAIFKLRFGWGLSGTEIGNLFGFSESRACQRIQRIQKCVSARVKAERSGDSSHQVASILREETERQLWGVGEITFERMETSESFTVESFNEKSF